MIPPLAGILVIKTVLDAAASLGYLVAQSQVDALMFMGFAVADLACLVRALQ